VKLQSETINPREKEEEDMKFNSKNPAAVSAAARGDFENFLVAATPGGIERQEAMGQAALVGTLGILPKDCPRADLEKLGFKFGKDADDLFVNVEFPSGWSKKASDHSMWSELLDDKGRKRAGIFYKAAFYDRSAHMQLERRYIVNNEYLNATGEKHDWKSEQEPAKRRVIVEDRSDNKALYQSESFDRRDYACEENLRRVAVAWMSEHFPQHEDVTAYW
jgi:hypothetical protein